MRPRKYAERLVALFLLTGSGPSCSHCPSPPCEMTRGRHRSAEAVLAERLNCMLAGARAWPSLGQSDYDVRDWCALLRIAHVVQSADPMIAADALDRVVAQSAGMSDQVDMESKLYLLIRLVFELPTQVSNGPRPIFKIWIGDPASATVGANDNPNWPVEWQSGQPRLIARRAGSAGKPYGARGEYLYFLEKYHFRDLSAVNIDCESIEE